MARLLPLILLTLLLLPAAARADEWTPEIQSCASELTGKGCAVTTPIGSATDVAVSPDGRFAYVIGRAADSLVTFERDPVTGALTKKACLSAIGGGGCAPVGPMDQPSDIEISPDGRNVYVAVVGGVTMFDRGEDGILTHQIGLKGCVQRSQAPGICTGAGGIDAGTVAAPSALELSPGPNPSNLYVGTGTGAIVTLDRDPGNGVLSANADAAGCVRDDGEQDCFNAGGLGEGDIRQLAVSPDGRQLYAPATASRGAVVFNRAADGTLTQRLDKPGCITATGDQDRCLQEPRLGTGQVSSVELSPDGAQLYVAADDRLVALARDAGSGTLSFASCVNHTGLDGCATGVRNVRDLGVLAFSADGEDLVASSENTFSGLSFFHRDAAGRLTQTAGLDGCVTTAGSAFDLSGTTAGACRASAAVTGNGRPGFVNGNQFYVGFQASSAVVAFKREFAPRCPDQSLTTAADTALAVAFGCTDRNGDALTFSVVSAPGAGQLGAIDTAAARVFYNPFGGFSGADSFRFRAFAGGQASAVATVSLTVAPAAGAAGPAGPPLAGGGGGLDTDRDGFFAGQDCNDGSAAIRPGALEVRGNRVDENCDGLAEPFPTVTSGVSAKWDIDGARFKLTQLTVSNPPKGARLEFRCTGRGCPVKAVKLSGKARRGLLNARPSLGRKLRYRAGQTIEVRISATGFNTKVAQIKLRAAKVPSVVALCLAPGAAKPQKTCT